MSPFALSLLLMLTLRFEASATPEPRKKDRPTKLAHYQIGVYIAAQGAKLRVNVDKELGAPVYIQLTGQNERVYYDRTLRPAETNARISVDISDLTDGTYLLKVSNGLEVEMRDINISTRQPTTVTRSIVVL